MNLEFIKPQKLGSLLMKSSQSNFNLRSPGSYLIRTDSVRKINCGKYIGKYFVRNFSDIN